MFDMGVTHLVPFAIILLFFVFFIKGKLEWRFLKNVFKKELNIILTFFSAKISSHNLQFRLYLKPCNEFLLILLIFIILYICSQRTISLLTERHRQRDNYK